MVEIKERNVCAYPWQQMNIDLTGEVVPCCFWSGYGNAGKPLGNTNENTIDEIWNGEAYRELRRANATGELEGHPCHECLAWKWSDGRYPDFTWPGFRAETGKCWTTPIPEKFRKEVEGADEPVLLHEDGVPLPHPDAIHDHIREQGGGRYSVWGDTLYFSASDDSDPRANGKLYELVCGEQRRPLASVIKDSTSGENLFKAYDEYAKGEEVMEAKPSLISFIATSDCNIDCPSCSQNLVRLLKVQHRAETELDVMAHIPYLFQLIWHGGEPYLIKHFREFVDSFRTEDNPNLTFGFTSNGVLVNEEELAKLAKFPRINASVSMDSFNEETFHQIRAGANFGNVLRNVLRAIETYDAPDRVFSVGMIINKVNFLELADNLQFAIDHDIGLNLSPVVVTPCYDRLDIFHDFPTQTQGWHEVLDRAMEIVVAAENRQAKSIRRVNPRGMVEALRDIYQKAARRYAETFDVRLEIHDPHDSLHKMKHPGIIVAKDNHHSQPLTYVELVGDGKYTLRLPRQELAGGEAIGWYLVHDLDEFMGIVDSDPFRTAEGHPVGQSGWDSVPSVLRLEVPPFEPVVRTTRNIQVANFGLTTPDGLHVLTPETMLKAYNEMLAQEREEGRGRRPSTPLETVTAAARRLTSQRYDEFAAIG